MQERRKSIRQNIRLPLVVKELSDKTLASNGEIMSRDLSDEGIAFESPAPFSFGKILEVEIKLVNAASPQIRKVRVMRCQPLNKQNGYVIGAMFEKRESGEEEFEEFYPAHPDLEKLLENMVGAQTSDLHLTVGCPPAIRIQKRIKFMGNREINDGEIEALFFPILTPEQIEFFKRNKDLNFCFSSKNNERFRVNLHVQKGVVEATIRRISNKLKNFQELGLPVKQLENLCKQKSGLILIAGRAGAGKTTTLASMIDYINQNLQHVIITIEDPVEYVHRSKKSIIKQRELGSDTHSFASALRNALRQDPDIVVIGEILDGDTVLEAISAAETGHLVFATVHAHGVIQAIERLINLFPVEVGPIVTKKLSVCLKGIISQVLVPSQKGGMVLATEYLFNSSAVKNTIREGRLEHLGTSLQTGKDLGMYTMQSSFKKLESEGHLTRETAESYLSTIN